MEHTRAGLVRGQHNPNSSMNGTTSPLGFCTYGSVMHVDAIRVYSLFVWSPGRPTLLADANPNTLVSALLRAGFTWSDENQEWLCPGKERS